MERVTVNPKDYTVLVVDDNLTNLKVVVNFLREFGFKLLMVKSGLACLEAVQTRLPDIILLDVMMPEMDGFETCQRLKADARTQDIPVIFMTALASEEDKVKGFEVGAVDYVTKPIQQREVLARVNTHLRLIALLREQEHQRKMAESLREISQVLNSTLDQQQLLQIIMEQLRQVIPFDGGAVFLLEEGNLVLSQAIGFGERYIGQEVVLTDNSSVVRVFKTGSPIVMANTAEDERWVKWRDDDPIASWVGVPLVSAHETVGVITVDSFTVGKYTEADLSTLQIFANHAATAIRNARLYSLVQRVNEELVRLNANKDKFFSIVAHDLKGPFLPLLGNLELIQEMAATLKPQEMEAMSAASYRSAKRVYELLDNLLYWARLQMGRVEYDPLQVNLHGLVAQTLQILAEIGQVKQIEVINEVAHEVIIYADSNMLKTIIRNLVNNALKFTPQGGQVKIFTHQVDALGVTVAIRDTGLGMSEEIRQKLFKLDQHVTTTGTNKEAGTGLGLILCQEMVLKHGGQIWVESAVGAGTTVYVRLPYPEDNA